MHITLPKSPQVKEKSGNRAIFEIEGLFPGYGVTIGNALRRVLYSSLPGAAITRVKIKGAPHEFSTLAGVLEDILEITLNIKQIYVKLHGDEPQTASIKVKGAKEIKASDIVSPSQVEIANPDAHIATLTSKDSVFEAEFLIEPGLGYVPIDRQEKGRAEIGSIPLDAIFTPMRHVNFEVENMRIGDRTDYNRLRLTIETNGTVSPEESLRYASELLVKHFEVTGMVEGDREAEGRKKEEKSESKKKTVKKKKKKEEEKK
ncbi:MAG: DNA-directed RNA polymerase subunit alpha [Candidatus Spechtbacteria bacterium]|nr:DNA-directed RNA polymerase subunit alpha [Candidatus Spechtbacteria bacterium]